MATDTRQLPSYFSVDADFRNWCIGIAAQLVVAGMVKTADTGQINTSTVLKPSGSNQSQGYEIYRFSDAAQATAPIFFKIEYGCGLLTNPALWVTVGTGSDGAGNITSIVRPRQQRQTSNTAAAGSTLPSYCSGDGSYLALINNYNVNATGYGFAYIIDRLRDATGAVSGDGFSEFDFDTPNQPGGGNYLQNTPVSYSANSVFLGPTNNNGGGGFGAGYRSLNNSVCLMPIMVAAGQIRFLKAGVFYSNQDLGSAGGVTFTATNLGAVHTYLTARYVVGNSYLCPSSNDTLAILWE